jgi:hypothetical protein
MRQYSLVILNNIENCHVMIAPYPFDSGWIIGYHVIKNTTNHYNIHPIIAVFDFILTGQF